MTHDVYTIAHLSDLHVTPVRVTNPLVLLNKRILGWLSWTLRRQRLYRSEVFRTLITDLHQQLHDAVVVTGDIANLVWKTNFRQQCHGFSNSDRLKKSLSFRAITTRIFPYRTSSRGSIGKPIYSRIVSFKHL